MPLFKVGNFGEIGLPFAQTAKVVRVEHKDAVRFPRTLSLDT
jgi:hypothetical protein